MSRLYKLILCIFILCAFISCEKEDPITSRFEFKLGNFEFPQGEDEWDDKIVDLYDQYKVRIIYKGITQEDLLRTWIGSSSSSEVNLDELASEDVMDAVNFLADNFFPYMSREIADKMFPPYIYLGTFYSAYDWMYGMAVGSPYSVDGMDNWVISIEYNLMPLYGTPDTKTNTFDMAKMIETIYDNARDRGILSIPEDFSSGVDYQTDFLDLGDGKNITAEMKANPNYYLNRGFIDDLSLNWYTDDSKWAILGKGGNTGAWQVQNNSDYKSFLRAIMTKPESVLREKYKGYELINKRFDILYKQFDDVGVNLHEGIVKYEEDGVTVK